MVHRTAEGFTQAGVMSKTTLREFDETCLTPVKHYTPSEIESLRRREEVSQGVFARYLGLSRNLISQWERGEKKPSGSAMKLLTLIDKHDIDFIA